MNQIANLTCAICGSEVTTEAIDPDEKIKSDTVAVYISFICKSCGVIKAEEARLKPEPSLN